MSLKCPLCETLNPDDAAECASCGRLLAAEADLLEDVAPLAGLEQTVLDPLDSAGAPPELLAGLEPTQLAGSEGSASSASSGDLPPPDEVMPGVERTQIPVEPSSGPQFWTVGNLELDRGREQEGERTPRAPDTAACPWCGTPSMGLVCDACGRRKSKFTAPPAADAPGARSNSDDTRMCPNCFARVAVEARCPECQMPMPLPELY